MLNDYVEEAYKDPLLVRPNVHQCCYPTKMVRPDHVFGDVCISVQQTGRIHAYQDNFGNRRERNVAFKPRLSTQSLDLQSALNVDNIHKVVLLLNHVIIKPLSYLFVCNIKKYSLL